MPTASWKSNGLSSCPAAKVNGGKRVVGIEQTTRDNIARIISRGISEGKSQIELKKEIQSEMGSTESRAKLIARQETSTGPLHRPVRYDEGCRCRHKDVAP